ncbi:MAG TPA: ATP-dependent DNA ligase [Burkholderiales bacterium]|nr:ATP-dependent DNA ligase [Burkholderiales bacterium]
MTLLADVVRTSAQVGATSGRLAKAAALAERLRSLDPDEIEIALPYLSGDLRQGKLALGYRTLSPGEAAASPTLTLRDVDSVFEQLKTTKGRGSASQRAELLDALFGKATAEEQDFLVRLIVGELRQGALEGVMLEALAAASGVPAALVRRAAMIGGGIAPVAHAALTKGQAGLERFAIRPMRPILPMLAQPAAGPAAALDALGEVAFEWKLDGARVQVHKAGDEVRVFTRTLNDVTAAVPEVVAAARNARSTALILDGEAIALRGDGRPHPFQTTMRRLGRKADDASLRETLPVSVFFFDCLFHDEPLVDRPLRDRRHALEEIVEKANLTPWMVSADPAAAEAFYQDALEHGHEGIMAKALEAPYEAGRRGSGWLKIKRAHTLDLVVIAAEWGNGRRKGWLSNLHLAARDPAGGFIMLGKTFKGMTDAMLEWQTRELQARASKSDDWVVHVRPELVVEIEFNDIQKSPQYPAGLALRLARVKRYRTDKQAEDADTIDTVRSLYEQGIA